MRCEQELLSNMSFVPFGDLLLEPLRNGLTKPKAVRGDGVKMIGMGEIFANSRIGAISMSRAPVTEKELSNNCIKKGDILFARQSLALEGAGKCSIVIDVTEETVFESHLIRARIDSSKANPYFVYYYFNSYIGKEHIKTIVEQVAAAGIRGSDLVRLKVPCPDLETQDRIAAILSALDEKIAINREINGNLLAQAQTLYKQFFPYGVQDDLPDGWRIGTVGEIIEIHDSKRIPLAGADRTKMEKKIYPYYGAASLMDFVDNYIFDGKYLLLGEDGTVVDDAGYPILQYVWGQFWVNNHAHILTGRLGYDVESLYMLFKQTPVKSIVTGAVQPKISQANLRSVQVVIPPEHNLREYNDLVEPLFSLFRANEEECKTFTALRDTLLPKLMSGEIDVSAVQL